MQVFDLLFTVLFFYILISTSYYLYKVRKTKSKSTNESKDALRLVFLAFFLYGCGKLRGIRRPSPETVAAQPVIAHLPHTGDLLLSDDRIE